MKADYQQRVRSQRSSAAERVLRSMNAAELQLPAKEPQKIEAGRHNRLQVRSDQPAIVFRRAGRRGAESTESGKKDLVSPSVARAENSFCPQGANSLSCKASF